jgi:hypothetical protein
MITPLKIGTQCVQAVCHLDPCGALALINLGTTGLKLQILIQVYINILIEKQLLRQNKKT